MSESRKGWHTPDDTTNRRQPYTLHTNPPRGLGLGSGAALERDGMARPSSHVYKRRGVDVDCVCVRVCVACDRFAAPARWISDSFLASVCLILSASLDNRSVSLRHHQRQHRHDLTVRRGGQRDDGQRKSKKQRIAGKSAHRCTAPL